MNIDLFVKHYPYVYHMAEYGAIESILTHGLLSTTALLDKFEITGEERHIIECCRRPESVCIAHSVFGKAIIRDQKPICDSKLAASLVDCTPVEWYRLLNRKVFFWSTFDKLITLLHARAYTGKKYIILTVGSDSLLETYYDCIRLTHINTGAMPYGPRPRGLGTFVPIGIWPFKERPRAGGLTKPVTEVTVDYSITDIKKHLYYIKEWSGSDVTRTLWSQ